MGWKRRAALAQKEEAMLSAERAARGEEGEEPVLTGPWSLQEMPSDAKEISFDTLMGMLSIQEDEGDLALIKAQRKEEWRAARKLVNIDALFSPR